MDLHHFQNKRSISFPIRQASLAVLYWLTLLLGAINAENETCIYSKDLSTGDNFEISYPESSPIYKGEVSYLWSIQSANRIEIFCDLFIPPSTNCVAGHLIVESNSKVQHKHCGCTMFGHVLNETPVSIQFWLPSSSAGGRFSCTVKALEFDEKTYFPCGIPTVLDDKQTRVNGFPMMSALVDLQIKIPFCGSTIIHDKYVLTAAHCLLDRNLSNTGVLVGDHDYATDNDTDASRIYEVEKGISHPNYDPHKNINNIAVIRVKEWMQFDERVAPAYLPFQYSDSFGAKTVVVPGWQSTKFVGDASTKLLQVVTFTQTNLECKELYPTVNIDQICTDYRTQDSCGISNGGPVLWMNRKKIRWEFVGVLHRGINCSATGNVNARVRAYIDWIASVTPDADYRSIE